MHPAIADVMVPELDPFAVLATHGPLPQYDAFDVYDELQLVPFVELQAQVYGVPTGRVRLCEPLMVRVAAGAAAVTVNAELWTIIVPLVEDCLTRKKSVPAGTDLSVALLLPETFEIVYEDEYNMCSLPVA